MAIEKNNYPFSVNSTNPAPLELVRRLWNPRSAGPGLQVAVSVKTGHYIGGCLESVERTQGSGYHIVTYNYIYIIIYIYTCDYIYMTIHKYYTEPYMTVASPFQTSKW